jgi:hypothetical protein
MKNRKRKAPLARRGRFSGAATIAFELGLSTSHVWRVLSGERANIGTAERIRAAYARLHAERDMATAEN